MAVSGSAEPFAAPEQPNGSGPSNTESGVNLHSQHDNVPPNPPSLTITNGPARIGPFDAKDGATKLDTAGGLVHEGKQPHNPQLGSKPFFAFPAPSADELQNDLPPYDESEGLPLGMVLSRVVRKGFGDLRSLLGET